MRLTLSVIKADFGSVGGDDSGRRGRHAEANIPAGIGSLGPQTARNTAQKRLGLRAISIKGYSLGSIP
jgi:hypothetical protein